MDIGGGVAVGAAAVAEELLLWWECVHSALALAAILEKVSAIMAIRRFIRMTTVKMKNVNLQRNANSVSRNTAREFSFSDTGT